MHLSLSARIEHIFVSPAHNYFGHYGEKAASHPAIEVEKVLCVAGRGIHGDRFFDHKENYKGQITFFSMEVFETVCEELHILDKSPSVVRRNVFVRGIDLNRLIGHAFTLQGISFQGTEECRPCPWMDEALAPGAERLLKKRGGLRARILSDGHLKIRMEKCWQTVEVGE